MALSKQYKKLIRRMAQSRFPGEEADIEAKADQQYSEFWKTTPDIGGKDNMQFKDLDFLIAFFSFYEACDHRIGIPELDEFAYEVIIKSSEKAGKLIGWNSPICVRTGISAKHMDMKTSCLRSVRRITGSPKPCMAS